MFRRTSKLLLRILAVVGAGLAILVVIAAIQLSRGPLSVGFIAPYIVSALEPEDESFQVDLDDALLAWDSSERSLELRAVGVKITDPSGEVRAAIPELTIGFNGRALLLDRRLAPTSLEIVAPSLTLVRGEDGRIRIADEVTAETPAETPEAAAPDAENRARADGDFVGSMLSDLLLPPGPSNKLGYLTAFNILDADLTLEDRKLNMTWRAPSATFTLLKGESGLQLKGIFGVDVGGETAEFQLNAEYNTIQEIMAAELALADIQPARFAATAPVFADLAGIKLPLSGTLRAHAGFDGTVQEVALDLTGGQGTLVLPWESDDNGMPVRSARLRATLTHDLTVAEIAELTLDFNGPRIAASGSVQGVSQGVVSGPFELAAELAASDLPLADLKRLWPPDAAANARRWVAENVADGAVQDAKMSFSDTAGEDGIAGFEATDVSGGFRFSGVSVSYFPPLPAIQKASGSATLHLDQLNFAVTGGEVQGLQIGSGKIDITGLNEPDQHLAVETVVRGAVRQVLTLLDHPRLGFVKGMGVKPADVGGNTAVRLLVRLPLIDALTFKDVEIAAAANLRGVTLPKAAFDLDLSAGDLTLQLDGRGMDVSGTAVLGDIPINLVWAENFAPGGFARQFTINATIDDGGRRSMGLDLGGYLQGPVGVNAVMTQYPNRAKNSLSLNADLAPAVLDISEIGWRKEAGARGTLKAELNLTGEKPTAIRSFALNAEQFAATGAATFGADGKTVGAVRLDRLAYGRSDVSGEITRRADGGFDLSLRGKSLDAAPLLSGGNEKAGSRPQAPQKEGELVPLNVALTLQTLHLSEHGALTNVSARMQRNNWHWRSIQVDGQPAPGKFFSLSLAPDGFHRRVTARSDDAGGVFKALGIMDNIVGGTLQLNAIYDDGRPNSPLNGKLEAQSFRLVNAPAIAKLLSVALLTGILDSLRGEGIGFDRLDVPFTVTDDVIETKNARMHGPAMGMTAEGWINLRTQTLGMRGTLVPAYAVNSILGNIPLVGRLLGPEGSGVFAATYRMTGNLEDPDVSVNPLATLAPGFLRGLFGIFEGGVPRQPDPLPDPSLEKEAPLPEPPLSRE